MPITRYGPEVTRNWSTRELGDLIDRDVSISVHPDGSEPQLGRVSDAGIGRFGRAWIEFDDGKSIEWDRSSVPATVLVEKGIVR